MSIPRVVLSSMVLAIVTVAAVWYSSERFPLAAAGTPQQVTMVPGPLEQSARPITQSQLPKVVSAPAAPTPPEAAIINASGTVVVKLTVDRNGNVAEVRPVGFSVYGPGLISRSLNEDPLPSLDLVVAATDPLRDAIDALVRSAASTATQWTFEPPTNGPVSFYAAIFSGDSPRSRTAMLLSATNPPSRDPSALATPGVGAAARGAAGGATSQPSVRGGTGAQGGLAGPGKATISFATRTPTYRAAPPPSQPAPAAGRVGARIEDTNVAPGIEPVRVGGYIQAPRRIKDVKPVYPQEAQEAGIWGIVIMEITIDVDGNVADARIVRSIPGLDDAALEAVRQWQFLPTLVNGAPVPLVMNVTINFTLN